MPTPSSTCCFLFVFINCSHLNVVLSFAVVRLHYDERSSAMQTYPHCEFNIAAAEPRSSTRTPIPALTPRPSPCPSSSPFAVFLDAPFPTSTDPVRGLLAPVLRHCPLARRLHFMKPPRTASASWRCPLNLAVPFKLRRRGRVPQRSSSTLPFAGSHLAPCPLPSCLPRPCPHFADAPVPSVAARSPA